MRIDSRGLPELISRSMMPRESRTVRSLLAGGEFIGGEGQTPRFVSFLLAIRLRSGIEYVPGMKSRIKSGYLMSTFPVMCEHSLVNKIPSLFHAPSSHGVSINCNTVAANVTASW